MKRYIQPNIKNSKTLTQPFALDLHSGMGDNEQLQNESTFDEDAIEPAISHSVWSN